MHKVDPSEVWKILNEQVLLNFFAKVIGILLEF
jgi:hypothetical protein